PTGLVVSHVLSELRQLDPFKGKPNDYIDNGGFRIVTTIDKRAQDAAEAAADIRRPTAPEVVRGQPANWQAALVSVEPGTGRVLAYYGGSQGTGADYAGWYYDEAGVARGRAGRAVLHRTGHRTVRHHRHRPRQRHGHLRRRGQARGGALRPRGDPARRAGVHREAHPDQRRPGHRTDRRTELDPRQGGRGQAVQRLGRRR